MWARSRATCTRCRNRASVELTTGWGLAPPAHAIRKESPPPAGFFVSASRHCVRSRRRRCRLIWHAAQGLGCALGRSFLKCPYALSGFSLLCPCRPVVQDCGAARARRAKDGCSETSFAGRRFLGPAVSSSPRASSNHRRAVLPDQRTRQHVALLPLSFRLLPAHVP
jgi:hypothetical protein